MVSPLYIAHCLGFPFKASPTQQAACAEEMLVNEVASGEKAFHILKVQVHLSVLCVFCIQINASSLVLTNVTVEYLMSY